MSSVCVCTAEREERRETKRHDLLVTRASRVLIPPLADGSQWLFSAFAFDGNNKTSVDFLLFLVVVLVVVVLADGL